MDRTDGHFFITYDDVRNLYKALQIDPNNPSKSVPVEVSSSLEDLLKRCHESGLKHLEGLSSSAIDEILEWFRALPALELVEALWEGESNLTRKGQVGFRHPAQASE